MYALHALWQASGRLVLWAEDAHAYRTAAEAGDGRARAHPYACPAEAVAGLLAGVGPRLGWLADQASERWATLWLPSLGGAPMPSPQLPVGTTGRGVGRGVGRGTGLAAWRVPCLRFEPAEAAQLLGELFDPRWSVATVELPGGGRAEVAYGASLRWLTAVHDLAWRLVGAGAVLPVARHEDGGWCARWQPAPDEPARREAADLARGCPPVCRAEAGPETGGIDGTPPARTGTELLSELLDVLVDCEARAALDGARQPEPGGTDHVEHWLAALGSPSGRLAVPAPELQARLAAWYAARPVAEPAPPQQAALQQAAPAPDAAPDALPGLPEGALRLCFRLDEPVGDLTDDDPGEAGDAEDWRLEFLLQSVDQPSLLITAADLWQGGPGFAALARARGEQAAADPLAACTAELARAALHRPELRPALSSARPTGIRLDRAGALVFLRDAAPALAEAGFGVLLPAWWQRRPRLGLTVTARTSAPGSVRRTRRVDRDSMVDFQWQVALGGITLSREELAELAAAQQGLVRRRGHWVEADPAQIRAALDFLSRHPGERTSAVEVLRLALDPSTQVSGLPVHGVDADGLLGELLAGRAGAKSDEVELPAGFGTTLRPYQQRGLAWLRDLTRLGLGALLADDMGLGKTVQTLALLAQEQAAGASGPVLLVCPMSLVGNWQREAARFAPMLTTRVHHGADRRLHTEGVDLLITTYGLVQRDLPQLRRIRWRRVVADEAQLIKNPATAQSRAIRALHSTGPRLALTGTPVENRLAELHAVLDFANPGLFGTAEEFRERYAIPVEQNLNGAVASRLQAMTRPFVLRRLKTDPAIAADLPAKQEITVWCNLTAEQAGLYQAVVAELLQRLGGIRGVERKGAVLAAIGRLKQVCNHPAQLLHDGTDLSDPAGLDRSGKVARLTELLAEALAEGDRVLVFTQYAEFARQLQPYLAARLGVEVLCLHGGVPKLRREELVARFQRGDGPPVFLISLRAGGTGLNLTAANQVIHLDRWWNPAVEDQATDRAFRIGQRRNVQVRRLVCVGTVEERIAELIEAKRSLAETVVGDGEQWLGELSADALRELLTLSADAVGE